MAERRWEHFSHSADIGVRGIGPTKAAAFEEAAIALTSVITDADSVAPAQSITVHCADPDDDILLLDWLNALVFEMATRRMLFGRFGVEIEGAKLSGTAAGETVDPARHRPAVEVKGATFTELLVRQEADGQWVAQCVVDV